MATCALVAAGDFNSEHFTKSDAIGAFDEVCAVDGGYAFLDAIGREPDVVVGDFDSLGYVPQSQRLHRFPMHKDKSDLELAFDQLKLDGFDEVVVYGAIGGRLDHTIANLQMACSFAEDGLIVTFIALDCAIRIVVGPSVYHLPDLESGTVSVFSAVDCAKGVTEQGLEYPLENADLTNRTTLGVSNELIGEPASIEVSEGTLYVFHPLS